MNRQKKDNGQPCPARGRLQTTAGALLLILGCATCPSAHALDVEAGDYTALPAGTNLGLVYFQHSTRDSLYANGKKVPINAGLDANVGLLRGVHFMDIGGYIVDPQFILPFGNLQARNDTSFLGGASGAGDAILGATVWLVNQPKTDTYFGITPWLYVPTGSYDRTKAINLGENRWKFALQAGFITGLSENVSLDLIGDVTTFGKNREFGAASATMSQNPLYQAQGFLRYKIKPTWDLRLGVSHASGGETSVNDVAQNDKVRTTKFTIGSAWFAAPTIQLMANYGRDTSVENGFRENNRLNLRLLKIF